MCTRDIQLYDGEEEMNIRIFVEMVSSLYIDSIEGEKIMILMNHIFSSLSWEISEMDRPSNQNATLEQNSQTPDARGTP